MQKFILQKWYLAAVGLLATFLLGLMIAPQVTMSAARQGVAMTDLPETQSYIVPVQYAPTADTKGDKMTCPANKLAQRRLSYQTNQQISRRRMMVGPAKVIEPYNVGSSGQIARSDSRDFTSYAPADHVLPALFTAF